MSDTNTNIIAPEYVYKVLSDKFTHGLSAQLNRFAIGGWEPIATAADQGKPGRSDCGVYTAIIRKRFEELEPYQQRLVLEGNEP